MGNATLKTRLLALLEQGYADQLALEAELSDAERNAQGTPDRWAPKDTTAHMTAWEQRMSQALITAAHGETPPSFADFDEVNARIFEKNRNLTWPDVLAESEHASQDLLDRVALLSEEEIGDPNYYPWRQGQPLWQMILGNSYTHICGHIAQFYMERGDMARATRIQEELVERLSRLSDVPRTRGVALYNLACFYATSGQSEKALPNLSEALTLAPDLRAFAQEDPDLKSLHDHPAFQALYEK
jgi:tetratricopeptide (TPR) repeat protein